MRALVVLVGVLLTLVVPDHLAASSADPGSDDQGRRVFGFRDPAITEASGLVDLGWAVLAAAQLDRQRTRQPRPSRRVITTASASERPRT